MSKYINLDTVIERLENDLKTGDERVPISWVKGWLETQEKADAVEVVRCKDCRHWHKTCFDPLVEHWEGECLHHKIEVMFENDFCSYGERRTDDEG